MGYSAQPKCPSLKEESDPSRRDPAGGEETQLDPGEPQSEQEITALVPGEPQKGLQSPLSLQPRKGREEIELGGICLCSTKQLISLGK